MNKNKKIKAVPFKNSVANKIYEDYIHGLKDFNAKMKVVKEGDKESLEILNDENPMQMSYNAGELGAMRAILIKYYGFKLEDLESREKWELEHEEV